MRLEKSFIHCIELSRSQNIYTIIYSIHSKDEYNIHEFTVILSITNTRMVLSTFVPSKSFRQLLNTSPTNYIYTEIF